MVYLRVGIWLNSDQWKIRGKMLVWKSFVERFLYIVYFLYSWTFSQACRSWDNSSQQNLLLLGYSTVGGRQISSWFAQNSSLHLLHSDAGEEFPLESTRSVTFHGFGLENYFRESLLNSFCMFSHCEDLLWKNIISPVFRELCLFWQIPLLFWEFTWANFHFQKGCGPSFMLCKFIPKDCKFLNGFIRWNTTYLCSLPFLRHSF